MTAASTETVQRGPETLSEPPDDQGWTTSDRLLVAGWLTFLVVSWLWGNDLATKTEVGLGVPPLHSSWQPRIALGTALAVVVGTATAWWGPGLVRRLPWGSVIVAVVVGSAAWGMALASNDGTGGWTRGVSPATDYATVADEIDSPATFLEDFVADIENGSHPTHVAGHPPGFVLLLWVLGLAGLGATGWAAALCIGAGSTALAVVALTVRAVAGEMTARSAAPFLVLSPCAIWLVTTADAFFALVGAVAVGALAVAALRGGRRRDALAAAGGLALGLVLLLSYGLVLLAVIPAVIAWRERVIRPLVIGAAVSAATLVAMAPFGFWWFDGLAATRERYWSGFAATRPFTYFVVANIAALGLCVGPSIVVALRRLPSSAVAPLVTGALIAVTLANLSAMSKGEVERIWLPFAIWILPIGAVYATKPSLVRGALLLQVATAVVMQSLLHGS